MNKKFFYEENVDRLESIINQAEIERRLELIFNDILVREDLKNKNFLDAGCGLGQFSQKAHERGAKVTALDLGEKTLAKVRQKAAVKTVVGDLAHLPFADNTFDFVLCTEVIEHTDNPQQAISELLRAAKPGGKILITTPNRFWLLPIKLATLTGLRKYQGIENWLFPWQLTNFFEKSGGKILIRQGFNLFYPYLFQKIEDRLRILDYLMVNYLVYGEKIKD